MMGYNAQAGASALWKETSGATERHLHIYRGFGRFTVDASKTVPFAKAYLARFQHHRSRAFLRDI